MTLKWYGDEVRADVIAVIVDGVIEFGLTHETAAKRELTPGHGVLTGTLRRSTHAAAPNYNFGSDDTPPRPGSPERSGQGLRVKEIDGRVSVVVGSGMNYARRIEQLYGFITRAHGRVSGQLVGIIQKKARQRGMM